MTRVLALLFLAGGPQVLGAEVSQGAAAQPSWMKACAAGLACMVNARQSSGAQAGMESSVKIYDPNEVAIKEALAAYSEEQAQAQRNFKIGAGAIGVGLGLAGLTVGGAAPSEEDKRKRDAHAQHKVPFNASTPQQKNPLQENIEKLQGKLDLPADFLNDLLSWSPKIVVIADDSSSMNTPQMNPYQTNPYQTNRYQTRWDEMRSTLSHLLDLLIVVGTDIPDRPSGFELRFLNSEGAINIGSRDELTKAFKDKKARGGTPLCKALLEVLETSKNTDGDTLVMVMTDGQPSDCSFEQLRNIIELEGEKDTPFKTYFQFMMCTEDDELVEKYNDCIDQPNCPRTDVMDDFQSEIREIQNAQGNRIKLRTHTQKMNTYLVKAILGPKMAKYGELDNPRYNPNGVSLRGALLGASAVALAGSAFAAMSQPETFHNTVEQAFALGHEAFAALAERETS